MHAQINRIAVVSSPRCGNTWISSVLADALNMHRVAVHNWLDIDNNIPERIILQIHWYREPNFQKWLKEHKFQVLSITRHPLDILLSVIHFIKFAKQTDRWLEGNVSIPKNLVYSSPYDGEFINYALSFGAENLLSISYQWHQDLDAIKLRYEDCILNTENVLADLVNKLGGESKDISTHLDNWKIDKFKQQDNRHGWQGKSGLYKKCIPTLDACKIYERHKKIFQVLEYEIEHYSLSITEAQKNWLNLF